MASSEKTMQYLIADGELVEGETEEMLDQESAFEALREESRHADEEYKLSIYRLPITSDGQLAKRTSDFMGRYAIDQFDWEQLLMHTRDKFGPGTYRVMVRLKNRLKMNRIYSIGAGVKDPVLPGSDMGQALVAMQTSVESSQKMMMELFDRFGSSDGGAVSTNPAEQMNVMVESMGKMFGVVAAMTTAMSGGGGGGNFFSQVNEFAKTADVLGFSRGAGGDAGDTNMWSAVVEGIREFVPAMREAQRLDADARPRLPARPPEPTATHTNPQERSNVRRRRTETPAHPLKPLIIEVMRYMKEGATPEEVAAGVMAQVPEGSAQENQLLAFIEHPDCIDRIVAIVPAAGEHRAWFEGLRVAIVAYFDPEDAEGSKAEEVVRQPVEGTAELLVEETAPVSLEDLEVEHALADQPGAVKLTPAAETPPPVITDPDGASTRDPTHQPTTGDT